VRIKQRKAIQGGSATEARRARRGWAGSVALVAVSAVIVVAGVRLLGPSTPDRRAELVQPVGPLPTTASGFALVGNGILPETRSELDRLTALLAADPNDSNAYMELGYAYLQYARETSDPSAYVRADTAFSEALQRDAAAVRSITGRALIAIARHDFGGGLRLADRALGLAPRLGPALGARADALTELGRYDDAAAAVQKMVDLRPDLSSYSRVSYQRELHGDIDGALEGMKRAFQVGSSNVENREYIRVLIADLFLLKGDLATAEQTYRAALETYPGFIWALNGLGKIAAAKGDLPGAIGFLEQAIARVPLPEFLITLAELRLESGQDATADLQLVRDVQGLFAANGVNTDLELALFEANHGDPRLALELATKAYRSQPNVKAADALAWALMKNGRLPEARQRAEEAIRLGTPRGIYSFHAGSIRAAQGDAAAAMDLLERAFEVEPHFSPLYEREARQLMADLDAGHPTRSPCRTATDPEGESQAETGEPTVGC